MNLRTLVNLTVSAKGDLQKLVCNVAAILLILKNVKKPVKEDGSLEL